jgi:serine/threonine protein kinase
VLCLFISPEVLANKKYSEKADVYSFGIVLWEIYSGQVPYEGMQQIQTGLGVLNKNLRPKIPHACPKPIANLIKQCWDKDPKKRPSFETILKKFGVVQNVRQHPATIARAATI